jgi:hypothetical protein
LLDTLFRTLHDGDRHTFFPLAFAINHAIHQLLARCPEPAAFAPLRAHLVGTLGGFSSVVNKYEFVFIFVDDRWSLG